MRPGAARVRVRGERRVVDADTAVDEPPLPHLRVEQRHGSEVRRRSRARHRHAPQQRVAAAQGGRAGQQVRLPTAQVVGRDDHVAERLAQPPVAESGLQLHLQLAGGVLRRDEAVERPHRSPGTAVEDARTSLGEHVDHLAGAPPWPPVAVGADEPESEHGAGRGPGDDVEERAHGSAGTLLQRGDHPRGHDAAHPSPVDGQDPAGRHGAVTLRSARRAGRPGSAPSSGAGRSGHRPGAGRRRRAAVRAWPAAAHGPRPRRSTGAARRRRRGRWRRRERRRRLRGSGTTSSSHIAECVPTTTIVPTPTRRSRGVPRASTASRVHVRSRNGCAGRNRSASHVRRCRAGRSSSRAAALACASCAGRSSSSSTTVSAALAPCHSQPTASPMRLSRTSRSSKAVAGASTWRASSRPRTSSRPARAAAPCGRASIRASTQRQYSVPERSARTPHGRQARRVEEDVREQVPRPLQLDGPWRSLDAEVVLHELGQDRVHQLGADVDPARTRHAVDPASCTLVSDLLQPRQVVGPDDRPELVRCPPVVVAGEPEQERPGEARQVRRSEGRVVGEHGVDVLAPGDDGVRREHAHRQVPSQQAEPGQAVVVQPALHPDGRGFVH